MDLADPEATKFLVELLAEGNTAQFAVTGGSMRPFLKGGETVLLRRVLAGEIHRGDLLLWRQSAALGSRLLLHRVVRIHRAEGQPAIVQTQGDALAYPDPPVAESAVLGRVHLVITAGTPSRRIGLEGPVRRIQALLIAARQDLLWRARRIRSGLTRRLRPATVAAPSTGKAKTPPR